MKTAELLTVEEVADRLRCHPQTVRRFIWSGKLAHVKVGGMVRVPETALNRLIEEGEARSTADGDNRGIGALRAVLRSRKANREDVEELERVIDEGEQSADWGSPV